MKFSEDELRMLTILTNIAFCQALDDSRLIDKQSASIDEDPLLVLNNLHKKFMKECLYPDVPDGVVEGLINGAGI